MSRFKDKNTNKSYTNSNKYKSHEHFIVIHDHKLKFIFLFRKVHNSIHMKIQTLTSFLFQNWYTNYLLLFVKQRLLCLCLMLCSQCFNSFRILISKNFFSFMFQHVVPHLVPLRLKLKTFISDRQRDNLKKAEYRIKFDHLKRNLVLKSELVYTVFKYGRISL